MKIALDVDGVLVDFVGATARLMGFDPAVVTMWDYYPAIGISEAEFWKKIEAVGADFWLNIDPYPWMGELLDRCKATAPTILLTTPSKAASSAAGKVLWMQHHFGHGFRDYLIGPKKEFCARPDTVLIDDSDANVNKFREHGGHAILFPRPWNDNRHLTSDPMAHTLDELQTLVEAIG